MSRALVAFICFCVPAAAGGGAPLVELKAGQETYRGRVVAKDESVALLLDRDGAMVGVPLAGVTGFGVAEKIFRPYSSVDLRDKLSRRLGSGEEVVASPHYVVTGRPEAAKAVAAALEEVHDGYRWFCSTRNLPISSPEFPLVAIVLPNRSTFDVFCRSDDVTPSSSLQGYYRDSTNRFVCFESGGSMRSGNLGGARDTLVHEAIHQLAFNTGLHVRMGQNPVWVVEGFATALEPPAARRPLRGDGRTLERANLERLKRYLATPEADRIQAAAIVASDEAFDTRPLDAYATAWAMTFYLLEAKPTAYSKYLKTIAARNPLDVYSSQERLADFKSAFGTDLRQFEAELGRSLKRIAAGERR